MAAISPSAIRSLKIWNWSAASVHFICFVFFACWLFIQVKSPFRSATIFRIGVAPIDTPDQLKESIDFPANLRSLFKANIPILILLFFGFTVVFHVLYASDFFGAGYYTKFLQQGWNPVRWLEYAISASIMIFIIGTLSGARDITTLTAFVTVVAITQGFGFLIEKQFLGYTTAKLNSANALKALEGSSVLAKGVSSSALAEWLSTAQSALSTIRSSIFTSTGLAWGLILVSTWVPILYQITEIIRDANALDSSVPTWVPIVVVLQLVQFSCFGFVQAWQVDKVAKFLDLPNFAAVEKWYILLSFMAKVALGGFISYGLVQRQNAAPDA